LRTTTPATDGRTADDAPTGRTGPASRRPTSPLTRTAEPRVSDRAPVQRLADAAASAMTREDGAVGVVRRFDRRDRESGAQLRDALQQRGVAAVDLAAVPDAAAGLGLGVEADIRLVVAASPVSRDDAHRVAARLGVPVVSPEAEAPASEVVEMWRHGALVDVALTGVEVTPEQHGHVRVSVDGTPVESAVGAGVAVSHRGGALHVRVGSGEERAAQEVLVTPVDTVATLVRDGVPCVDVEEPLTLAVADRLEVRAVGTA
jgi:hypothetical protein